MAVQGTAAIRRNPHAGAAQPYRQPQQLVGHRVVVAVQQRPQQEPHPTPLGEVEPPIQPEVEEADPVTVQEQQVAGVRVGMEQTVAEDLAEHRLGTDLQQPLRVQAGGAQLTGRRRPVALDQGRGEHPAGAALWVDLRDDHPRVLGEPGPHPSGHGRFLAEVQLTAGVVGQLRDRGPRPEPQRVRAAAFEPACEPVEQRQVLLDLSFDPGALDLDGDRLTVGERGPWTCEREAAANGVASKSVRSSASGAPSSASMIVRA